MVGISEIEDLLARKRALVNQSEICRENLKSELQNLALSIESLRKRVDKVRSIGPWLLLGLPVAAPLLRLFSKNRTKGQVEPGASGDAAAHAGIKGGLATALLALRLYRKYVPLARSLVTHLVSRYRKRAGDRRPAANI
jgi:hypothetical protein